jgi:HPt (histidine-containing phosphotransfer) domain-containing protein
VTSERDDFEVDLSVIEDLAGGDGAVIAELIGMFIRNTAEAIEKMRAAISAREFRQAALIAHTAAGFTATVGIQALVAPLRGLERAAQEADAAEVERLSAQWERIFEQIRKTLKARLLAVC